MASSVRSQRASMSSQSSDTLSQTSFQRPAFLYRSTEGLQVDFNERATPAPEAFRGSSGLEASQNGYDLPEISRDSVGLEIPRDGYDLPERNPEGLQPTFIVDEEKDIEHERTSSLNNEKSTQALQKRIPRRIKWGLAVLLLVVIPAAVLGGVLGSKAVGASQDSGPAQSSSAIPPSSNSSAGFPVSNPTTPGKPTSAGWKTNIDLFSDEGCGKYVSTYQSNDTTGTCVQMAGPKSVQTTSNAYSCAVTVYTDSNCSVNATLAGLGRCETNGTAGWYSYSIDCGY